MSPESCHPDRHVRQSLPILPNLIMRQIRSVVALSSLVLTVDSVSDHLSSSDRGVGNGLLLTTVAFHRAVSLRPTRSRC